MRDLKEYFGAEDDVGNEQRVPVNICGFHDGTDNGFLVCTWVGY